MIRDARLFLGDGMVIDQASVLIKDGKIAEIYMGPAPDAKSLRADAIEAAGKTLLPGLIDVRVHLSLPGFPINDPQFYQNPDQNFDRELAAYLYCGVTAVKSTGDQPEMVLKHQATNATGERLGAELFASNGTEDHTYDRGPGCHRGHPGIHQAGRTDLLDRSLVRQVIPRDWFAQAKESLNSPGVQAARQSARPVNLDMAERNLAAAYRSGATLVTGTDSGNPMVVHGPGVHRELQLWVEAGIPPAAALQGATYNAARLLHADSRIGLIRKGYDASLLLVDGNPLQDISATERISTVFFKGERVDRSSLFEQK